MATQMHFQYLKINKVLPNPENPRVIKDHKYKALVKSIKDFPKMLEIRPIVVNTDMVILGGNMRLRACQEAGLKEIPVIVAKDLTESEQREFTIKDNVSFGEWDWDVLANDWDDSELNDWGLDVWKKAEEIDLSILNEDDLSSDLSDMTKNIKKAIQIEFEMEHYEAAQELVKWWREQGLYIGGFLMEKLKEEKEKNV
jgi:ParB-like chromosome segregation protein Spo0J